MAISDFIKSLTKSSLLAHLKNVDQKTMKWRKDLLDAVVTKDEMTDWAGSGGIDHGELGGLTDDDHTQYILANGTRALTAAWDAGNFEIRSSTFESDVATGTAPLTIASTTKVANLNSDLLDDQTGSYYLDSANFTGTNWTDLTDGGATTLHKHDHGGQDGLSDDDHTQYVLRNQWLANGFVDPAESTLAWSDANRTLTIDKVGANFKYYHDGTLYTVTSAKDKQIDDTEGLWVFYFDGATLSAINSPTDTQIEGIIEDECIVAFVYWDATNNDGRLFDERHGYTMSPMTHHYLHDVLHAQYDTGMTPTDVLADQTGDLDTHAQFGLTEGKFYDEDYKHTCSEVASNVGLEIYYFDGTDLRWTTNAGFSVLTTGSGRLAYNNSGAQAEIGDNKFVLCHVFGTNIKTDAGADKACIAVQGQAEYDTLTLARAGANTEINALYTGDLPMPELIPVATFIFQTKTSYGNSVNARIRKTDTGDDYVDWRGASLTGSGGASASDHGMLSGLSDDDHTQYLLADGTRGLSGDWDAGTFEIRANTFESDVATGTAPLTIASTTAVTNLNADLLDGDHTSEFFHDNEANEINALTEKSSPALEDVLVIEDSADSWAKKKIQITSLPFGASVGGGDEFDIDFEDDEGYVTPNELSDTGYWTDLTYAQYWIASEQTVPGGALEGCALKNNTSSSGARVIYTVSTWTSGVVDVYYRASGNINQLGGIWLGDATFAANGIYFGLVTASGGDTTGFQYNSIGTPETYHTHFGTTNSSNAYWIRAYVDITNGLGKMKGWSGAIGDEPSPWGVERTFTGACPNPLNLGFHIGTTSNSSSYFNIWEIHLTNTLVQGGTLGNLDHGALDGLADDDHTQYILANGTRALTSNWDAGGYEIRSLTFESDVATGTAPFTIASTTVNTNLNADMVDGVHEASFALVAGTRDFTGSQAWSNAAGPKIMNEAASATNPTLVPNKADDNTGIGWNSADQLTFVTGGVETCTFKNGSAFIVKTMDIQTDNAKYFRGTEAGSTQRNILGIDSSDDVQLGATNNTLVVNASDYVLIDNASSLSVGDVGTDELTLINATTGVLSQHDSAYITTENYVSADLGLRSKLWETNLAKTLADGVADNFFKWSPTTQGDHGYWVVDYSIYVEYIISATTYFYQKAGTLSWFAHRNATQVDSGALTEISAPAAINTGAGTITVTLAAPADGAAPRGPSFTVALSGLGVSWSSGTIQYSVISCDSDHRGYTTFT